MPDRAADVHFSRSARQRRLRGRPEAQQKRELQVILKSMKIGKRGQVKVPRDIRLKALPKIGIRKWRGKCAGTFSRLGYSSVDEFIEDIRGR
jgi:hypothetical protein